MRGDAGAMEAPAQVEEGLCVRHGGARSGWCSLKLAHAQAGACLLFRKLVKGGDILYVLHLFVCGLESAVEDFCNANDS